MGLSEIIRLGLELEKRKIEFSRKNDKDNYIQFLESKNSELLKEIQEIIVENEDLAKKLEEYEKTKLSKAHLEILELFINNNEKLNELVIKTFINSRPEYEIAFSELIDWQYVHKLSRVINIYNPQPAIFYFNTKYKTEVLKLLVKI